MSQKVIYVREEDSPLFDRAAKLGEESLSAVVAEALRRFIAAKEAEAKGMEEITITVGVWAWDGSADNIRKIRFVGRLLADGREYTGQTRSGDDRGIDYEIYATQRGKVLLWWKYWSRWEENDVADYAILDRLPILDQEVVGKRDNAVTVPGSILAEAAEALGQELIEVLDV